MMNRARKPRAFTLLELLVAVTITMAIAAVMVQVTAQVLDAWRRTQDRHAQLIAAKLVLDTVERDLQTMVWRRDATRYFAAEILDSQASLNNHGWLLTAPGPIKPANGGSLQPLPDDVGVAGEPLITSARFGLSGVWLRFLGCHLDSGGTMPVVIAYKIARRPVTGHPTVSNLAPIRYALYRSAVSESQTFTVGYDVTNSSYGSSNNNTAAIAAPTHRNPSNVTNPGHGNLIASNVVDFGCWLYRRESSGALQRIYPDNIQDTSHVATGDSTGNSTRMPDVVDVSLRILSEQGAILVEAIEAGRTRRPPEFTDDAAWWWSVVEQHSLVVARRIEIRGGAL